LANKLNLSTTDFYNTVSLSSISNISAKSKDASSIVII
jgi:hypothetical protein